jgi:integrase
VVELFEYAFLLLSGFVKSIMTTISTKVKRASKYHDIWLLGVLLRYIRDGPPSESLPWPDLMARAAAVFMIFLPCRPIAMIRMDGGKERWVASQRILVVGAKEKMDKGRGYTELVFRELGTRSLCPLTLYRLLKRLASEMGAKGALFCSADGKPFATSAPLSRLLKRQLKLAGIDPQFPAYSIRHALITALFDGGLSEVEVNAYTGHSNNTHTAAINYNHLNHRWVGHALMGVQVSERARLLVPPVPPLPLLSPLLLLLSLPLLGCCRSWVTTL